MPIARMRPPPARPKRFAKRFRKSSIRASADNSITASFGVTELQTGDTPETMLRRADRALLQAKDQGRNQVVQLGDGMMEEKVKRSWWPFQSWRGGALVEATLVTMVPIEVAVQKLRGFIADQEAKIIKTNDTELELTVTDSSAGSEPAARTTGRSTFLIQLKLSQQHAERSNTQGFAAGTYVETRIDVQIRPRRDRDRRREATVEKARRLLGSLKSYLMAREDDGTTPASGRRGCGLAGRVAIDTAADTSYEARHDRIWNSSQCQARPTRAREPLSGIARRA